MNFLYKADSWLISKDLLSSEFILFSMARQLFSRCKNNMKTKAVVAGLVVLAAALASYYIIKRKNRKTIEPIQKTHHLTDVFSKAKSYAK
jgi:hypothetical protein